MSFVITAEQKTFLEDMAAEEDRSISSVLRKIISDYMIRRECTSRFAKAIREIKPIPGVHVAVGEVPGYPTGNEG